MWARIADGETREVSQIFLNINNIATKLSDRNSKWSLRIAYQIRRMFNKADKNKDGKLTPEEWRQVLNSSGVPTSMWVESSSLDQRDQLHCSNRWLDIYCLLCVSTFIYTSTFIQYWHFSLNIWLKGIMTTISCLNQPPTETLLTVWLVSGSQCVKRQLTIKAANNPSVIRDGQVA